MVQKLLKFSVSAVVLCGLMGTSNLSFAMNNEKEDAEEEYHRVRTQKKEKGKSKSKNKQVMSEPLEGELFPNEILLHLFSFLDIGTQLKAGQVCRLWHQVLHGPLTNIKGFFEGNNELPCRNEVTLALLNSENIDWFAKDPLTFAMKAPLLGEIVKDSEEVKATLTKVGEQAKSAQHPFEHGNKSLEEMTRAKRRFWALCLLKAAGDREAKAWILLEKPSCFEEKPSDLTLWGAYFATGAFQHKFQGDERTFRFDLLENLLDIYLKKGKSKEVVSFFKFYQFPSVRVWETCAKKLISACNGMKPDDSNKKQSVVEIDSIARFFEDFQKKFPPRQTISDLGEAVSFAYGQMGDTQKRSAVLHLCHPPKFEDRLKFAITHSIDLGYEEVVKRLEALFQEPEARKSNSALLYVYCHFLLHIPYDVERYAAADKKLDEELKGVAYSKSPKKELDIVDIRFLFLKTCFSFYTDQDEKQILKRLPKYDQDVNIVPFLRALQYKGFSKLKKDTQKKIRKFIGDYYNYRKQNIGNTMHQEFLPYNELLREIFWSGKKILKEYQELAVFLSFGNVEHENENKEKGKEKEKKTPSL